MPSSMTLEFSLQDPCGVRKELTPKSCPLICTHTSRHTQGWMNRRTDEESGRAGKQTLKKIKKRKGCKMAGDVGQLLKDLHSMQEALSSIPNTT